MYLLLLVNCIDAGGENTPHKRDINDINTYDIKTRSIDEYSFEFIASSNDRIYKKIIDDDFIESCPPIINSYPNILRQLIEKHIYSEDDHSEFFELKYESTKITLSFVVDFEFIKETIDIVIDEYTHKSFEQKVYEKLDVIRDDMTPKLYILQKIKYTKDEDIFVNKFEYNIAHQDERERFRDIVDNKYLVMDKTIVKRDPLILEVNGNNAHIFGWVNSMKLPIILPEESGINSDVSRIIGKVSLRPDMNCLVLKKNKINLVKLSIHPQSFSIIDSFHTITSVHSSNQYPVVGAQGIRQDKEKYFLVDIHFLVDIN